MIKLKELKILNFLSFKKLEMNFEKGIFLIDGWNYDEDTANGAGKSAIIDSICFALYGDLPRKVKFEEVINWDESTLDMQLSFESSGKSYFIHRSRNPNVLNFYVDTNLKNGKDMRETQQIITEVLKISLDTFLRSVYYSQNNDIVAQFLFSNDEEKKDVLTELLDLHIFDDCCEKVKKDSQIFVGKKDGIIKDVSYIQKQNKEKEGEIERLQKLFDTFEEMREIDVQRIKKRISDLKSEKIKINADYKKECGLSDTIDIYSNKMDDLEKEIDLVFESRLKDAENKLISINKELQILSKQLKEFDCLIVKGKCPTCFQSVNDGALKDVVTPLSEEINQKKKEKENLDIQVREFQKKVDEMSVKKKEVNELKMKIITSQTILKKAHSSHKDMLKNIDRHLDDCDKQLSKEKGNKNNYGEMIKEFRDKIDKGEKEVKDKNEEVKKITKLMDVYYYLIRAFSREGVKSYVFAKIINEINHYINDYLVEIFDANISLRFDIESLDSKGKAKQKIDTVLTVGGEQRNINILSGGEKARLILATNFALSKIISTRCSSVPNFICLDECFTGLDVSGKEKMMVFLRKLSENKDFVYIVDHTSEFKSLFDGIYNVEKRNGESKLVV